MNCNSRRSLTLWCLRLVTDIDWGSAGGALCLLIYTGTIVMVKLTKRMDKMLTLIYAFTLHSRIIIARVVRRVGRD